MNMIEYVISARPWEKYILVSINVIVEMKNRLMVIFTINDLKKKLNKFNDLLKWIFE